MSEENIARIDVIRSLIRDLTEEMDTLQSRVTELYLEICDLENELELCKEGLGDATP